MPYKEKQIEKLYYSIGEVARMFNVNTSLIRFWEKEFDIIKPKKNKKDTVDVVPLALFNILASAAFSEEVIINVSTSK